MSSWITPAGNLGTFTQSQPLSVTLQATPTLGGSLQYLLVNSTLPPGLTLNQYSGQITGTPQFVDITYTYTFTVSATEYTYGNANPNPQTFSLTVSNLHWTTPTNLGIETEQTPLVIQLTATPSKMSNTVKYALLNGNYPAGNFILESDTGLLTGTADEVNKDTFSKFTIRATEYNGSTAVALRDRTFTLGITGQDDPYFITPSGTLFTVNDSTWFPFQVEYGSPDPDVVNTVTLINGSLPPGLEIDSSGLIRGYALPPDDGLGNPINKTYTFTLQVANLNGSNQSQFSITINNQQLVPGFVGRAPTLLNNRPMTFVISPDDQYSDYYFSGDSMGTFLQSTDFVYKFLGYNFDTQNDEDLSYQITGLTQAVDNLISNNTTGWQNGTVETLGPRVETYNVTARVYKTSNPSLISETFLFSITVLGSISTEITWLTPSNLGNIVNGTVSDISVAATAAQDIQLQYRLIGAVVNSDIRSLIADITNLYGYGLNGSRVTGNTVTENWQQTQIKPTFTRYNFNSAVLNQFDGSSVVVGYDQNLQGIIINVTDGGAWSLAAISSSGPLNCVIYDGSRYISVGDRGTIKYAITPSFWVDTDSGITENLRGIAYNNDSIQPLWVAVGDAGTILVASDLLGPWARAASNTNNNIKSVIYTGYRWLAVGDAGTILWSDTGLIWYSINDYNINFNAVYYAGQGIGQNVALLIGESGAILSSDESVWETTGRNIISVIDNQVTNNNLYTAVYVDGSYYLGGDAGTVLQLTLADPLIPGSINMITSSTLGALPPNLYLQSNGDIVGKLAFESTSVVQPANNKTQYTFNIQAYSPEFAEIVSTRTFTLTTVQEFYYPWDIVYMKLLGSVADRNALENLLYNNDIIPQQSIYRPDDPNFGKSTDVRYNLLYGIPSVADDEFYTQYLQAVKENFYWRNITLGPLKTAIARDINNKVIYEVVYSEIIDDLVNPQGVSIPKQIVWPRPILADNSPYWTSTDKILSDSTYYDKQPSVSTVVSVATVTDTITVDSVQNITVGQNVTGAYGVTVTPDPDTTPDSPYTGQPPVVVSIDAVANTVTLAYKRDNNTVPAPQTLQIGQQLLFSDPVFTSLDTQLQRDLYPASLDNMRTQLYNSLGRVNDPAVLPRWMTSQQVDGNITGYVSAWVICYTKPGYSQAVKNNIDTLWPYKLNQLNFQLDRIIVDRSTTYNYLGVNTSVPGRPPIWNTLPSAQPYPQPSNSENSYVYFPQKSILPVEPTL